MIFISHRGNLNGRVVELENEPQYIDYAISKGFDVEIDVWYINGNILLGHDNPIFLVDFKWILERNNKIWIHCKNVESVLFFKNSDIFFNYFWHQKDDITLTSKNQIWAYPGKQPIQDSIAVLPEIHNDDTSICSGICSDFVERYKLNL